MPYRTLFQLGAFKAHSGETLQWKIECSTLSFYDWKCLAYMTRELIGSFGSVEGVPRGGLQFAIELRPYITTGTLLIVDNVLTTGGRMDEHRGKRGALGVVVFARGPCPKWITPIFQMSPVK